MWTTIESTRYSVKGQIVHCVRDAATNLNLNRKTGIGGCSSPDAREERGEDAFGTHHGQHRFWMQLLRLSTAGGGQHRCGGFVANRGAEQHALPVRLCFGPFFGLDR